MVEITTDTPLAEALNAVIQPKLVEVGWSTGGAEDSAPLSEYIILMLVNGKTQDQIAAELSGDLLQLGPDDPGAIEFSRWLFEQVDSLHRQLNGNSATHAHPDPPSTTDAGQQNGAPAAQGPSIDGGESSSGVATQDMEMDDGGEGATDGNM